MTLGMRVPFAPTLHGGGLDAQQREGVASTAPRGRVLGLTTAGMRCACLAVGLVLAVACGRTAPVVEAEAGGGSGGVAGSGGGGGGAPGGGPGGGGGVAREPLLVDFDFGRLTGHTLDGQTLFVHALSTEQRGRSLDGLTGGVGQVGCTFFQGGTGFVLARRDGRLFRPENVAVRRLFLNEGGAVVEGGDTHGHFIEGETVHRLTQRPLGGVLADGLVPTLTVSRTVRWVDARRDTAVRVTAVGPVTTFEAVEDHLFAATVDGLWESTPERDTKLAVPFVSPVLLAANRARQALVSDPRAARLVLADFGRARVDEVRLESPGLRALGPHVDQGLALDDEGFVYASFLGAGQLHVLRTNTLGATWTKVAEVAATGLTVLRTQRRGGQVLVVGGTTRGRSVADWRVAVVVVVSTGRQHSLPLQVPQATVFGNWPVALSPDGRFAAFWEAGPGDSALSVFDAQTRQTTAVERRALATDALVVLPRLVWME